MNNTGADLLSWIFVCLVCLLGMSGIKEASSSKNCDFDKYGLMSQPITLVEKKIYNTGRSRKFNYKPDH